MAERIQTRSSKRFCTAMIVLAVFLAASVVLNLLLISFINRGSSFQSYLQDPAQIYVMEAGILKNNLEFQEGTDYELTYDFDNSEYAQLIELYEIDKIAGDGTEFDKARNLMYEFAPRLFHKSDYDNSVEMNALALLAYSLDNPEQGINCRNKAQILNEMCLALGIYSRKVWLLPNSEYDNDCHVVNEIWDTARNQWIMLDITNNQYWVDEMGKPLSVLEIREKGAQQEFCTPVSAGENTENLEQLRENHIAEFLYIMKNMVAIQYCSVYSLGESDSIYTLCPKNLEGDFAFILSQENCEKPPIS